MVGSGVAWVAGEAQEAYCRLPSTSGCFGPQVHRASANDSAKAGGDSRDPRDYLSHGSKGNPDTPRAAADLRRPVGS